MLTEKESERKERRKGMCSEAFGAYPDVRRQNEGGGRKMRGIRLSRNLIQILALFPSELVLGKSFMYSVIHLFILEMERELGFLL